MHFADFPGEISGRITLFEGLLEGLVYLEGQLLHLGVFLGGQDPMSLALLSSTTWSPNDARISLPYFFLVLVNHFLLEAFEFLCVAHCNFSFQS